MDFFFPVGSTWKATLYADAADTHPQTNSAMHQIKMRPVKARKMVAVTLAPGGGHGLRFLK